MKLNPREHKVLTFLANEYNDEFGCYPFAPIARRTRLPIKQVRLACRSLKRKGFTEFHRGLWTMNGEPAGSGYRASKAGCDFIDPPRNPVASE